MSANPELWKQIIADREKNVLAEIRIRHALAERNSAAGHSSGLAQAIVAARAWVGQGLVVVGQRVQGLEANRQSLALVAQSPQPCGDQAG